MKPTTLEDCFWLLESNCDPKELEKAQSLSEDKFVGMSHHGMGMWIRNNWGLWSGDSGISKFFRDLGIYHADDMSGIILTSFHRHLLKKPLEIDKQVEHYLDFWKKQGVDLKADWEASQKQSTP